MESNALFATWGHVDVHKYVLELDGVELAGIFIFDYHFIYLLLF